MIEKTKLTVRRATGLSGGLYDAEVLVDGLKVMTLKINETKSVYVFSGPAVLRPVLGNMQAEDIDVELPPRGALEFELRLDRVGFVPRAKVILAQVGVVASGQVRRLTRAEYESLTLSQQVALRDYGVMLSHEEARQFQQLLSDFRDAEARKFAEEHGVEASY